MLEELEPGLPHPDKWSGGGMRSKSSKWSGGGRRSRGGEQEQEQRVEWQREEEQRVERGRRGGAEGEARKEEEQ